MQDNVTWPKRPARWIEGTTLCISIPFTWNLPALHHELEQRALMWDRVLVGGPAIKLLPEFFSGLPWVEVGGDLPGVLQRVNPMATRTTTGCVRKCGFCAIGRGMVEPGGLVELDDWPNLPIIADNNLLAASESHFDRVIDRLLTWGWADFNQGLDARLLSEHHAERLAEIPKPMIRLALDSMSSCELWEHAYQLLRAAGMAKHSIRSYCLIGYQDTPAEAWKRCEWVQDHGVKALPMWYHDLFALEWNKVTDDQRRLGWDEAERMRIVGWYYQHRGSKPESSSEKAVA